MPSSLKQKFFRQLDDFNLAMGTPLCVAVSGGADSLALALLLKEWANKNERPIFAVTVDHGLRAESANEVKQVKNWLSSYDISTEIIQLRELKRGRFSLQERARNARYQALIDFCQKHSITSLFLAHHEGDQIETVLHRLVSGSGLDGMRGMEERVNLSEKIEILRPLLAFSKTELVKYLQDKKQDWIEDPSNQNNNFTRVRLREIMKMLQNEGLSGERIQRFSIRMQRASQALDFYMHRFLHEKVSFYPSGYVRLEQEEYKDIPNEIRVRTLREILKVVSGYHDSYTPLKRIEHLDEALIKKSAVKKTLMDCVINADENYIFVFPEKPKQMETNLDKWKNRFEISLEEGWSVRFYQDQDAALFKEKANQEVWNAIPTQMRYAMPVVLDERKQVIGNIFLGYEREDTKIKHRFSCFWCQKS